ncbi:putative NBD/HSP70 family sugar kinase/DNA-binding transcriptional ArsR family regulator [Streptosporangium album]|uniref:Putative NBD/HSP70 family sugar kinase/DNA-binding transcriptional ArsR family regulator n=1 Tax=Streptosporangium album TaxID=47479 RepID=A0A7W7W6W0_9ACTN|nr:ROK family transcriptional regulator [Streptosporangium album]MBB4936672.1 putative NBD/HSP70 family sugar kinase/DNA-binding transcriptional ArsR family regulator [Streptosporangium album]
MKTATPQTARAINDRLALDLLLEHRSLTAPQLRALIGLSRPTVSDLVERLRVNGLIEVVGESGEERRGPNARVYGIVADRAHVAGVDVRRDTVSVTVADITGQTVGSATRPLETGSPVGTGGTGGPTAAENAGHSAEAGGDLARTIAAAVAEAAGPRRLHAVVVGAPGMVNPQSGELVADNGVPGWRPHMLQALRHRIDAPVTLENEVNLAAVAEHRAGSARGREDFVLLWLDEGVGGAVTLGGRLRRGVSGGAGEVGALGLRDGLFCDVAGSGVIGGLDQDSLAARIAEGAFTSVALLDPGLVVLGGKTGRSGGDPLAARVSEHLAGLSPVPTQVRASTVEGNAILHGALFTALSIAHRDIFGEVPA